MNKKIYEILRAVVFTIILAVYAGFVLKMFWNGFLVSGIGAPSIDLKTALGITIIMVFVKPRTTIKDTDKPLTELFWTGMLYTTVGLILGGLLLLIF